MSEFNSAFVRAYKKESWSMTGALLSLATGLFCLIGVAVTGDPGGLAVCLVAIVVGVWWGVLPITRELRSGDSYSGSI
jgi:hypothetical protein